MKTGPLLEELINIARISKTDFAISMNMSPSGLSKILTGKRLPLLREKRTFGKQAANHLANAIYCDNCRLKFKNIFPVLYDFTSKYELAMFLADAIGYALDRDFSEENGENTDYPNRGSSFLGEKTILNMFCVIVSGYAADGRGIPLEFYSTLPLFSRLYSEIFHRIKLLGSKAERSVVYNHFFDLSSFEASYDDHNIDVLSCIVRAQQYVDLNLWRTAKEIGCSFLLLRGRFLLLFSIQMDGTPLMTFVTHKGYIATFFNSLMKRDARKISYNRSEAIAALEAEPSLADRLIDRKIDAVYNFISIGYLIKKEELEAVESPGTIRTAVLKLFNSILTKETTFFVTVDAMLGFCATGKAIVPLIGAIDIEPGKRIPYLKRLDPFIDEKSGDKIRVVNSELPKAAVLCSRGLSLVYLIDSEYRSEKIHCFETDAINDMLGSEVAESAMKTLDFTPDLWDSYLEEASRDIRSSAL